jgi:DNA helicase-2/ATP-dependent DNA helicase PcrA
LYFGFEGIFKSKMKTANIPPQITANLSDEQREPLLRISPNACILAAAGSGKTRTLVHLIVNDLMSGVRPEEIIAFTFTEKAAENLLARIFFTADQNISEVDLSGMFIGTIHAWCFKYLLAQFSLCS